MRTFINMFVRPVGPTLQILQKIFNRQGLAGFSFLFRRVQQIPTHLKCFCQLIYFQLFMQSPPGITTGRTLGMSLTTSHITKTAARSAPLTTRQTPFCQTGRFGCGQVRGVCVAGSGHMRCGSRHFPLRVRKNERTCDAERAVWPICVPRPDKNADRKRYSPGPGTEMSGTCSKPRLHRRRNSPPPATLTDLRPPRVHGNGVFGELTGLDWQRVHQYPPPGAPKDKTENARHGLCYFVTLINFVRGLM